jgi:hypothetical protein
MSVRAVLGLLIVIASPALLAQGGIVLCVDEQGRKTFTNDANARGCKPVAAGPITTVPAPRNPSPAAANPVRPAVDQRASAGFPRVDASTQRARDSDRRRILEDELKAEEERLVRLRGEFNNGQPERNGDETRNYARYQERVGRMQQDIQRHESNVTALKRELALLRD